MGKACDTSVQDGALNVIKTNVTRMVATVGQPASFALAVSGTLVQATMSTGDFTLAAGVVSGRRVSVAGKAGLTVATAGTADHVSLLDITNSKLLYTTTCPGVALTAGATCSIAVFDIEIQAPA